MTPLSSIYNHTSIADDSGNQSHTDTAFTDGAAAAHTSLIDAEEIEATRKHVAYRWRSSSGHTPTPSL
jgi:hypothetical protein